MSRRRALSRREFLEAGAGALIVTFAFPRGLLAAGGGDRAAAALTRDPGDPEAGALDSWLRIDGQGTVTLFVGKVELGTGVATALAQIAADELDVPVTQVKVVQGTTGETPDQGRTTGSKTLQNGGVEVRRAAATAREALLALAAARLGVPVADLEVEDGRVTARHGRQNVTYAALIGGARFGRPVDDRVRVKTAGQYRVVGRSVPRVELPAKVFGTHEYVHNIRVPGMAHGRVVRPPAVGATVASVDEGSVRSIPGVIRVVRRGNFLGVVAEREEQAIAAARALRVRWHQPENPLPDPESMYQAMATGPATEESLVLTGDTAAALEHAAIRRHAVYRMPFQNHASIGPSCAVADVSGDKATIWSGTQGSYRLRDALAALLRLGPERVQVVWTEASGCYGHNGADDAAADAALLSQATGRPVRVQWSCADELGWEPKGPAMVIDVAGGLDPGGQVVAWRYTVSTPSHASRVDGRPGNLLAEQLMGGTLHTGQVGGDRNARHSYVFPNDSVIVRWLDRSILRASALRGLGAPGNVFANESFVDELAAAAGADPVEFRLRHLRDARAAAVIRRAAALARWEPRVSPAPVPRPAADVLTGRGIAFAQYENAYTYVATIVTVEVNRRTGAVRVGRAWVAHDCGLIVNPDGLRNQIEGATLQGISRALHEEVRWRGATIDSVDWRSYRILTFADLPKAVEIELIDHPEAAVWGAGEPATCTVGAAIANAIFDATGVRLRDIPFTPDRVRRALG